MLIAGLAAVAAALLILSLAVLPGGPGRVPLSRLDPSVAPPASALAGAGAAAGAAVEKVLVKRGRLAGGADLGGVRPAGQRDARGARPRRRARRDRRADRQ
jgi:hypothetical protein